LLLRRILGSSDPKVGSKFEETYEAVFDMSSAHGLKSVGCVHGAKLIIVASCFSKRSEHDHAIVYASEADDAVRHVTFKELDALSNRIADALPRKDNGLSLAHGDAVGICRPMTPEAVVYRRERPCRCLLACWRLMAGPSLCCLDTESS